MPQKFLFCVSSQGRDLYSHQKLNMYIHCFSCESRLQTPTTTTPTTPDATVLPLGRHIAKNRVLDLYESRATTKKNRRCNLTHLHTNNVQSFADEYRSRRQNYLGQTSLICDVPGVTVNGASQFAADAMAAIPSRRMSQQASSTLSSRTLLPCTA